MSFLKQIQESKNCLKNVTTTVRHPDGRQFLENRHCNIEIQKTIGFVIDNEPDNIPVEIVPFIYLGSQDCCDPDVLHKFDIKYVLSVGIESSLPEYIKHKFVKCYDLPEINIIEILKTECLDFIKNSVNQHDNILIHCNAGVSRSASIIIGFLMLSKNISYDEAFTIVKSKRHCIKPNIGFERQLKNLNPIDCSLSNVN